MGIFTIKEQIENFKEHMNKKQREIFDLLVLELDKNKIGYRITDNFYLYPSKHYFELWDDLSFTLELYNDSGIEIWDSEKNNFNRLKFKKDINKFMELIK